MREGKINIETCKACGVTVKVVASIEDPHCFHLQEIFLYVRKYSSIQGEGLLIDLLLKQTFKIGNRFLKTLCQRNTRFPVKLCFGERNVWTALGGIVSRERLVDQL